MARKNADLVSAGLALNNIARELQKTGSLETALRYSNRALLLLKKDRSSLHYYMALLNRCHILCDLLLWSEAQKIFDEIMSGSFIEVKAASAALYKIINNKKSTADVNRIELNPTWSERLNNKAEHADSLTPTEEKFIAYISEVRRSKEQIIQHLFGDLIDSESANNRFKNLLSRIRKKRPLLVTFENGVFGLEDDGVHIFGSSA
jgi:hypothetical protein